MAENGRSLEHTPTWSVAVVCTSFVVVSFSLEFILHHLIHWLKNTNRKPLLRALEKMKEELMLLGFISLLITVTSPYIIKICIKTSFYDRQRMPCKLENSTEDTSTKTDTCHKDSESFISSMGLEQLHRFIFVMAVSHVFYSCLTVLLGIVKVHGWKIWEKEAYESAENREQLAELTRSLTLKRQSTFVNYHARRSWSKNGILLWMVCFFRQFGKSVTRSDYLALRLGFLKAHNVTDKYDFHSYIIRCLEDEFKDIVGISPALWVFVIAFMLFNMDGTNLYFWISFLPIILVVIVGAKLQHIIATLAMENVGIAGPLILKPRDELFWFKRPDILLHLIHVILFQDAFELATFIWIWWQFGWESCLFNNRGFVYVRIFSGFIVQIFCSYSTLPLYALVGQMGSTYKASLFQDNILKSIQNWRKAAKSKQRQRDIADQEANSENTSRSKGTIKNRQNNVPYLRTNSFNTAAMEAGLYGTQTSLSIGAGEGGWSTRTLRDDQEEEIEMQNPERGRYRSRSLPWA